MSYWKFEPTDDRDFTLHVNNGIAYRDTMPDEDPEDIQVAYDLLLHAEELIADKKNWIPLTYEHEGGLSNYLEPIKAVTSTGDRVYNPSASIVARYTLLGAIECAANKHYTPNSLRIALNAMQLVIESWISLGYNHDDRRKQEQKQAIANLDDYLTDEQASNGHSTCISALDEAQGILENELPSEDSE